MLGSFEQAANLRGKKSNVNQKTWKMVYSLAGSDCRFIQKDSTTITFSLLENKDVSIN